MVQPILLGLVLDYINYDVIPDKLGYTYAALLVLTATAYVYFNIHCYYHGEVLGMRLRSAYCSLIYQKVSDANLKYSSLV